MSSQLYVIDKINKLIDINKDIPNFKVEFNVKSVNSEDEYYFSIENQTTLDNNSEPDWKHITVKQNGEISGDFTIDDEAFQNYFIILKADKPTEVNVNLHVTPLSSSKEPSQKLDNDRIKPQNSVIKKDGLFCTRNLIILGVIIIAGVGLYIFVLRKKDDSKEPSSPLIKGSSPSSPLIKGSPKEVFESSFRDEEISNTPSLPSTPSIKSKPPIKQRTQELLNRLRRRKDT